MISEQIALVSIGAVVSLVTLFVLNLVSPALGWRRDELAKVRDGQAAKINVLEVDVARLRVEIDNWQEKFWTASALAVEQDRKVERLQQALEAANAELTECRARALTFSAELHDLRNKFQLMQLRQEADDRPNLS